MRKKDFQKPNTRSNINITDNALMLVNSNNSADHKIMSTISQWKNVQHEASLWRYGPSADYDKTDKYETIRSSHLIGDFPCDDMRNKKVDLIDYENSSTLEQCNNNNTIDGKNSNEFGIFIYSIKFDDENSISSNTNDHECFEKDNALFNDEKNCKFDNVDEENINDILIALIEWSMMSLVN